MSYYHTGQRRFYKTMASNYNDIDGNSPTSPGGDGEMSRRRTSHVSNACDACHRDRKRCDNGTPCSRCVTKKYPCTRTREDGRRQPKQQQDYSTTPSPPGPMPATPPSSGAHNQYGSNTLYPTPSGAPPNAYPMHHGYAQGAYGIPNMQGAGMGGAYGAMAPQSFPPTTFPHQHGQAPYGMQAPSHSSPQLNYGHQGYPPSGGYGQGHAQGMHYPTGALNPEWPYSWPYDPNQH